SSEYRSCGDTAHPAEEKHLVAPGGEEERHLGEQDLRLEIERVVARVRSPVDAERADRLAFDDRHRGVAALAMVDDAVEWMDELGWIATDGIVGGGVERIDGAHHGAAIASGARQGAGERERKDRPR